MRLVQRGDPADLPLNTNRLGARQRDQIAHRDHRQHDVDHHQRPEHGPKPSGIASEAASGTSARYTNAAEDKSEKNKPPPPAE